MVRAAIFDIDNTLLKGRSSERIFIRYLRARGIITFRDILRFIFTSLGNLITFRGLNYRRNKSYLKGKDSRVIEEAAKRCFKERVLPYISQEALEEIRKKREEGYLIVLLSGTLDVLIQQFKEYCSADVAIGTDLERSDGMLTGELHGVHPYGHGKALLLGELTSSMGISLTDSYGYADHLSDVEFLHMVGHPVAVNAHIGLRVYAKMKGWRVTDF